MKTTKIINRGKLLRLVKAGKMEARCTTRYTDDYQLDLANNYGRTDWKKCQISDEADWANGMINFDEWDFQARGGKAYENNDGIITLMVHSKLRYELRTIN